MKNISLIMGFMMVMVQSSAQVPSSDNQPEVSITYREVPQGKIMYGVFEGRPPCQEISRQLNLLKGPACDKMKWRLFLFQDSHGQPAGYRLDGVLTEKDKDGVWKITRGIPSDPDAVVFELETIHDGKPFYFLKGDDNVLFILDEHKTLRTGNANFSYTLNRVKLVQRPASELRQ